MGMERAVASLMTSPHSTTLGFVEASRTGEELGDGLLFHVAQLPLHPFYVTLPAGATKHKVRAFMLCFVTFNVFVVFHVFPVKREQKARPPTTNLRLAVSSRLQVKFVLSCD